MTRLLWLVTWSAFLGSTSFAQSLPKSCDPDDPKSCVQHLLEGDVAPFTGQLMSNRRAAKLVVSAGGCQEKLDLVVEREKALALIALEGEKALRASDQVGAQLQKDLLLKRMSEMEEALAPRWYERPSFVSAVTAVVSIAILAVSVKTVQALK